MWENGSVCKVRFEYIFRAIVSSTKEMCGSSFLADMIGLGTKFTFLCMGLSD